MAFGSRARRLSCALGVAVAAAVTAAPATAAPQGLGLMLTPDTSCSWGLQVSPDKTNFAYPDTGATYWASNMPIPDGGYLEISGRFPHARYLSLTTYSPQSAAVDGLNDAAIDPDPGSSNPFRADADRTTADRSFTVRLVKGQAPQQDRPANTLYTTSADGARSAANNSAVFVMRVYLPDHGTNMAGGVPLPTVTLVDATGHRTPITACAPVTDPAPPADPGTGGSLLATPGGLFGIDPPRWTKFTNLATGVAGLLLGNEITGDTVLPEVRALTTQLGGSGGFFENPDNKYIATGMDTGLGQVLVLHGKAPTTPHTLDGQSRMGTGEVRYWSICTNNPYTTAVYQCAYDEQIPLAPDGTYTIAISTGPNRPTNATPTCGITWLPAGPLPQSALLLRNMLPATTFPNAIQTLTPGQEHQGMGPYYPGGTYYKTVADFEATGCHPS